MWKRYELQPTNGRKSFNRKAYVEIDDEGNETLRSYGTPVLRRDKDGSFHRLWEGFSSTTGTHIKSFCGMDKKTYLKLEVEK